MKRVSIKFEWSDSFDATGQFYIFTGRRSGEGSSAVRMRDLRSGRETVLVPDDGAKRFSLPNLYRNDVIYVRSNALWRISLTGSNAVRLFPPP
ncbi:MAG TPA: hypothetical protein VJS65_09235 [Verrucomicrobiae bacterium]|nr:hypothetical protein [Verrucomicrobiae bacterium]